MMLQNIIHAISFILREMNRIRLQKYLLRLLVTSLLCCAAVNAQPIRFEFISTEDGLPDATIMCILKDRQGFLWFGTLKGIARYDGYSFKNFQQNDNNTRSIKGDIVYTMMEDRSGYIWIGSVGGGLNKFDPVTETFTHYQHNPSNPSSISHNDVYALFEDHEGKLWVGTKRGLDVFKPETGGFNHIHPAPSEAVDHNSEQVTAIFESPTAPGILWIGTWGDGFLKYDMWKNSFTHFKNDSTSKNSISNNSIRFIYQLKGLPSLLWLGTDIGGLNSFDIVHSSFTIYKHSPRDKYSISSNGIRSMIEDKHGYIWVGTSGAGLNRFDPATHRFQHYKHDPKDYRSICNNNVISLIEDETGVLWAGTREGVSRFLNPKEQFQVYQNDPDNPNSLTNDFLYSLYEDHEGILWISSGKGLNRFDPKNASFKSYQHNPNDPSSLRNDYVRTIYEDRKRNLWVGNTRGVLHKFDRTSGRSEAITLVVNDKSSNEREVRAICEERDGTFWVGTSEGLFIVDREKWTSKHVVLGPIGKDSSRPYILSAVYEDKDGFLWMSARNEGIIRYNKRNNDIKIFSPEKSNVSSINHHTVTHIFEDRAGDLWIATGIGGLEKYNRETETFTPFFKTEGAANNTVYGALEDSSGKFWMGTDNGLYRFDPISRRSRIFSLRHGLQGIGFNSRSFCAGKSGRMYFGGTSGFIAFSPDQIQDNLHIPPVYITKLKVFESDFAADTSLSHLKNIVLHHDQNFISFEFSALDFKDSQENKYAYKLEGLNNEWIYSNSRRYAAYTHLDPGTYTFEVKGSNNNGVWNEQGAALTITILPPWWRTTWAYLGYAIVIISGYFSFRRYELNRQRLKIEAKHLKEVDQLKSRFFANISHEFRTPLSLIQGPAQQILSEEHTPATMEHAGIIVRNTQRLLRLVNQLLDISKLESGQLNLRVLELDLGDIVKTISASFESLGARKSIRFIVDVKETPIVGWIDRDAVEKILVNLLSNAFKFTAEGGEVNLSLGRLDPTTYNSVEIIVADTGVGIPAHLQEKVFDRFYQVDDTHTREQEGTGIGLALTKELVELHRGTITVQSEPGRGSKFTVRIPIDKASYRSDQIRESAEEQPVDRFSRSTPEVFSGNGQQTGPITEDEDETLPVVLIIEDNADMRRYIGTQLGRWYRILEATNGAEGVEKALETVPDLIISDVMMPKMDGFEACRRLKTDERTSHIPFILLTAKAGQDHKVEGLETGADDYLVKPFDAKELLVRVRNLIENRNKLRETFSKSFDVKTIEPGVESLDDQFIKKAKAVVEKHLGHEQFAIEQFAHDMFLSRTQLHRKLKAITNLTTTDFIRNFRLQRAKVLLEQQAGTIAEIADQVGFHNHSYFAKCFKEQFGHLPSEQV